MSGDFRQQIAQSNKLRQTGGGAGAIAQVEEPKQPLSAAYEGIEGGTATDWAVILTALKEEHQAVEAHLKPIGGLERLSERVHENGTIYTLGRFQTDNCVWNVAVAQIEMGNASAGIEAIRAMLEFKPRVMLFVGIAGGIKDVSIGDVVAASMVYGYECGKVLANEILPRSKPGDVSYQLKQRAQAEARKDDWRKRIIIDRSASGAIPTVCVKPIAAGEKVVASRRAQVYEHLRKYYDDAIAVEMEGFGFLEATQQNRSVSAMVIRGISDLIDGKNDDSMEPEDIRQRRAAHHASAFAFTLLEKLDGEKLAEQTEVSTAPSQLEFDSTLPANMISLNICSLVEDEYFINAHHGSTNFDRRGELGIPLTGLLRELDGNSEADELLSSIDDCNMKLSNAMNNPVSQLLEWLNLKREESAKSSLYLIIDESISNDIPWEFLEVDEDPIGVVFNTVRQKNIDMYSEQKESCCSGGVLVYSGAEDAIWRQYEAKQFTGFKSFLNNLQKTDVSFGLVFIDSFSMQEKIQKFPTAYIRRSKLMKDSNPFIFVSGKINIEASAEITCRDFLVNFVDYGAKGIVGSLNDIRCEAAKTIAILFSDACKHNPGKTIPEILRDLRLQVWESLNDDVDLNCESYLAIFSHIYYGNPLATLSLVEVGGGLNE